MSWDSNTEYPWIKGHYGLLVCLPCKASSRVRRNFVIKHASCGRSYSGMPLIAASLLEKVKAGKVQTLDHVRALKNLIQHFNYQVILEPLWRACNFALTGDESHLLVNPIVRDVTRDVLKTLYAAGVPRPGGEHEQSTL